MTASENIPKSTNYIFNSSNSIFNSANSIVPTLVPPEKNPPAILLPFGKIAVTSLFAWSVFAFSVELLRVDYFVSSYNGYLTDLADRVLENATEKEDAIRRRFYLTVGNFCTR